MSRMTWWERASGLAREMIDVATTHRITVRLRSQRERAGHAAWRAVVLLATLTASAAVHAGPRVEIFSPEGTVKGVRQVTARFSESMVAFGDPRLPEPFVVDCQAPGRARWADDRNWVYDFEADLPAGVVCRFALKPDLHAVSGEPLEDVRTYTFDTGGPSIIRSMPGEGYGLDEGQIFILGLDAAVDEKTIGANAACFVDHPSERIPLDILRGEERERVLAQRAQLGYAYFDVLWKSGRRSVEKVARDDLVDAEQRVIVARCRRQLPPDTQVQIIWGAGIATPDGLATTADQTLSFRTRPAFSVQVSCERVNARAHCMPFKPLTVQFSAPVAAGVAARVTARDADGRQYAPSVKEGPTAGIDRLTIPGPFPEHAKVTVTLPADLTDDAGRKPENAARFPLAMEFEGNPPLVKFSGEFGILESQTGGVLPVTVRNVEKALTGRREDHPIVPGATLRVDAEPMKIARWIDAVASAMAPRGEYERDDTDKLRWIERTGDTSVFSSGDGAKAFSLPTAGISKEFEVLGIPLGKPGFYVVELASPKLGAALLGRDQPRYVATAALVTNLAVHFKWGREASVVWVTRLDTGAPVADAGIEITDYCGGESRWKGTTDGSGVARIAQDLGGQPSEGYACTPYSPPPLLVTARSGEDMSFTVSNWSRGIGRYDFRMPAGSEARARMAHSVLDRTLLRAGETVSMKHFLRRHVMSGIVGTDMPFDGIEAEIRHQASGDHFSVPVEFDDDGVGETTWTIPDNAKLGDYVVTLRRLNGVLQFNSETARFKVEQFRVPTMKAVIQPPAEKLVNPREVPLDLFVSYLSGGGAGNAPVKLRTQVEARPLSFRDYPEFTFGGEDVKEGPDASSAEADPFAYYTSRFGAYRRHGGSDATPDVTVQDLTLDANGTARVVVTDLGTGQGPRSLRAELEYQDANGERLVSSTRVPIWPAEFALGLKIDRWAGSKDKLEFQAIALDLAGEPVRNREIAIDTLQRDRKSYRKRLIGGFYAYETTTTVKRLPAACRGRTDSHGLVTCQVAPGVSGEIVLVAHADDGKGMKVVASTTAWIAGDDDWWFDPSDTDRMDLLPERKEYEAGETARFQVRMPFRHATALVTVEREGVMQSYVTELSGKEPVVEVPIAGSYAPNVFVSVVAVRGRVSWWNSLQGTVARYFKLPWQTEGAFPTALVDLSKPAYRVGVARINVGWKPHRLDVEVKPAQEVYAIRQAAHVVLAVKRADGKPLEGAAEVAIAAVDEGLLELHANDTWDLLGAMMGERGLEVTTSTAQMQVVGKRHYGRKAVPHGGGGGHAAAAAARERFDTLLLWTGRVKLDAQGQGAVDVPLNDSLSGFRIVAVAHAGPAHFGTGSASIRTTQDLMVHSGLPPLVRETDEYDAIFTVRNTSKHAMKIAATATATAVPAPADGETHPLELPPRELDLAAGASQDLVWHTTAPVDVTGLRWDVRVSETGGGAEDRLAPTQLVIPAYPVRVYQATLTQITEPFHLTAARPAGAISGRGGIAVKLRARLADGLDGIREYMDSYNYACLEQRVSRAIALRDTGLWQRAMAALPNYLDSDGLARYFPNEIYDGSDTLTSYVLAIAAEADWEIPGDARQRMIYGLRRFVAGRIVRLSPLPTTDLTLRKLAAIDALARHGAADPAMLDSITIDPNLWPTSAVLDWVSILRRVEGIDDRGGKLQQASAIIRSRLNFQGTVMGFSTERTDALWWLMISGDVNAVRGVLAYLDDPDWREDVPRMVRGALARVDHGHWNTSTANAWGVLALEKFSAAFESTPVDGRTTLAFGGARRDVDWTSGENENSAELPWREEPTSLEIVHEGGGRPWALVASRAALPLDAPLFTGYAIERTVTPVVQKIAGRWSRGDVARIRLDIDAQTDTGWVVVEDPVPAGASVLGTGLSRDSKILTAGEKREGWVYPAYEERRFEGFRAYYRFVPKGKWTVEYTVRFNNPGSFVLPATRVEAMYAPEMFGELPVPKLDVAAP